MITCLASLYLAIVDIQLCDSDVEAVWILSMWIYALFPSHCER